VQARDDDAFRIGDMEMGAALFSYYTQGELKAEGSSITEGIGQGRITKNLEGFTPDVAFQIRTRKRSRWSSTCWSTRAYAWAIPPGSTSLVPFG
jgi:hypothetical protein